MFWVSILKFTLRKAWVTLVGLPLVMETINLTKPLSKYLHTVKPAPKITFHKDHCRLVDMPLWDNNTPLKRATVYSLKNCHT
jgi:hypothetical protein